MGDALYRDYARQLAEYSTVKAFEHSSSRDGSVANNALPTVR
jgi:hypothetical protein